MTAKRVASAHKPPQPTECEHLLSCCADLECWLIEHQGKNGCLLDAIDAIRTLIVEEG